MAKRGRKNNWYTDPTRIMPLMDWLIVATVDGVHISRWREDVDAAMHGMPSDDFFKCPTMGLSGLAPEQGRNDRNANRQAHRPQALADAAWRLVDPTAHLPPTITPVDLQQAPADWKIEIEAHED